ncbi:MAG: ATP-binding cassette domain-containing protein [Peptoniphilaceae bacterium]|nr:ATP-binding cassette domain-containing protein [Peptoniphilaceae bacterium]MDD7383217.1 ATP-binding cassette domain-containing protein [Peptoniphilaceae bacterium]MDY3738441.1 ATP-binding cassette domain-containing protein [Peptoniphilaceae bacterium]
MIEIKNISKKIDGNLVLNDISLLLDYGNIYGFYGENGSGKTMLFRAICGFITLDRGEIVIDGKKLNNNDFVNDLGILLENPSFINGLSGFMNLKMIASILKKADDKRIINVLKKVGLFDAKDKLYKKYSLGMKQRLAIANVILEDPKIIILDEPTNAIDKDGKELLKNIILEEKKKNKLILISSHEKDFIEELSDSLYEMNNGKIIK